MYYRLGAKARAGGGQRRLLRVAPQRGEAAKGGLERSGVLALPLILGSQTLDFLA